MSPANPARAPIKAALFITCLADALYPEVAKATVGLLRRLGVEVQVPMGQTCCGQAQVNTGYPSAAFPLVQNHVKAFEGFDYIVSPSGSCTASVRHQHPDVARLGGDEQLAKAAEAVAANTYELSEFLIDILGVEDVGSYFPHRVTYHPTCHSTRLLGVGDRPLRLLRKVEGIDLVELGHAETCCGFGGTFAVKNSAVSAAMLKDKTAEISATGARVCTAGDASCLMHIGGGLSRQGAKASTLHLAQILASTRAEVAVA
jgi:L-lactate dehydrogenase complex protein LldE